MNARAPVFEPRPYQAEAKQAVLDAWAEDPATGAMVVAATGTGKTLTALYIAQDVLEAGGRVAWLAHTQELLHQPLGDLHEFWPQFRGGIVQASKNATRAEIAFCSVATVRNPDRLAELVAEGDFDLIVVDEAHHSTANSWRTVIDGLRTPRTRLLGLTATPDRADGGDLSEYWQIVYSFPLPEAVERGYLAPPYAAVCRLPKLDLSGVSSGGHGARRDYDDAEQGRALLMQGIVDWTVRCMGDTHLACRLPGETHREQPGRYLSCHNRPSLVYTASVEQARLTAAALTEAGWTARYLCGETPTADRKRLIAGFKSGRINALCSPAVLTEGFDAPNAYAVVLARATQVWGLFVQITGRGSRLYAPGWDRGIHGELSARNPEYAKRVEAGTAKGEFLVLDMVGASEVHSLVAAPVLLGGTLCVTGGAHVFVPMERSYAGQCSHPECEARVACFAGLQLGRTGNHAYSPQTHLCAACEKPRCTGNPGKPHTWVPKGDNGLQHECLDCGVTSTDPHAGLLNGRRSTSPDADWLRVLDPEGRDVAPETWAVEVADHGMLFMVGDRTRELWRPWWVKKGGRKARPLTPQDVPAQLVRAYADDLVGRAERLTSNPREATDRQREYASQLGVKVADDASVADVSRAIVRRKAFDRAIRLGLAAVQPAQPA